jgi:hypothetical protein
MREHKTGEAGASFIEESVQVACSSLIYASQILAAARDAAGSTCCSYSMFGGVRFSPPFFSLINARQASPAARSCHH